MSSAPVIQQPSKRRLQFFGTVLSFFQMQAVECCTASAAGRTAQHGILQNKLASLLLKKMLDKKKKVITWRYRYEMERNKNY